MDDAPKFKLVGSLYPEPVALEVPCDMSFGGVRAEADGLSAFPLLYLNDPGTIEEVLQLET